MVETFRQYLTYTSSNFKEGGKIQDIEIINVLKTHPQLIANGNIIYYRSKESGEIINFVIKEEKKYWIIDGKTNMTTSLDILKDPKTVLTKDQLSAEIKKIKQRGTITGKKITWSDIGKKLIDMKSHDVVYILEPAITEGTTGIQLRDSTETVYGFGRSGCDEYNRIY